MNLISKTKKIIVSCTITTVLIVGGATALYAQYSNKNAPDYQLISSDDYERMAQIVGKVNTGKLPVSALKDAEPLLERDRYMITQKTRAEYNALK